MPIERLDRDEINQQATYKLEKKEKIQMLQD